MFPVKEIKSRSELIKFGIEVRKCLLDLDLEQNDIVDHLLEKGFQVTKQNLSSLLNGIGRKTRQSEIREIGIFLNQQLENKSSA